MNLLSSFAKKNRRTNTTGTNEQTANAQQHNHSSSLHKHSARLHTRLVLCTGHWQPVRSGHLTSNRLFGQGFGRQRTTLAATTHSRTANQQTEKPTHHPPVRRQVSCGKQSWLKYHSDSAGSERRVPYRTVTPSELERGYAKE